MKSITIFLLLVTSGLSLTQAQEKILFKINPVLEKSILYNLRKIVEVDGRGKAMDLSLNMDIVTRDKKDSLFFIDAKVKSIKIFMELGIDYDSTKEANDALSKEMESNFKPLLASIIKMSANQYGKLTKDSVIHQKFALLDIVPLKSFVIEFPNRPIGIGDSWQISVPIKDLVETIDTRYTYIEKTPTAYKFEIAYLLLDKTENKAFEMKGFALVNEKTLLIDKLDIELNNSKLRLKMLTSVTALQ